MTEDYKLRQAVGRWWRIKIENEPDNSYLRQLCGENWYSITQQIGADIDHSDLLTRLLGGEEPYDQEPPQCGADNAEGIV